MQSSWLPFSMGVISVILMEKKRSFHVRISGSKGIFELLWFEPQFFEKLGVDLEPCKFRCSRFPGVDLYDLDRKTSLIPYSPQWYQANFRTFVV